MSIATRKNHISRSFTGLFLIFILFCHPLPATKGYGAGLPSHLTGPHTPKNNTAGKTVMVRVPGPVPKGASPLPTPPDPLERPDFELTDCSVSPEHPLRYHTAEIICHVINNGEEYPDNSKDSLTVSLAMTGLLGSEKIAPVTRHVHISPFEHSHQTEEFRFRVGIPADGSYTGLARVRFFSTTSRETNMANNDRHFRFSTNNLPDLQVYITQPSDVRVGGHKRWFRFFVKNIGTLSSQSTTLRLHIDGDGTHTWEVPPLAPGERFPGADKWKKRGIRWWKKGRKHYLLEVNREHSFPESKWDNNRIQDWLKVYVGTHFSPKATVHYLPKVYLKNHADFQAGRQETITFMAVNERPRHMTAKVKITIVLMSHSGKQPSTYWEKIIPALLPGERYAVWMKKTFAASGQYDYHITMYQTKRGHWLVNPVQEYTDHFDVVPVVGEPVSHE